jgi:hypothetical protein
MVVNHNKTAIQRSETEMKKHDMTEYAYKNGYKDGAKALAERLCEGRVSNDPVVIAVKVELSELTEKKEDEGK